MKKLSVLMSVLMASLFFVACDSDDDPKVDALKVSKDAIEVVIGETAEVEIFGGVAPYEVKSAEEGVVEVSVKDNIITVTAVAPEAPETRDGEEGEGEENDEAIVVTVTDAAKSEVSFKVTVTAGDDEGEGDDNEGDDNNEGGEEE